jgi:hypothetical protein
VFPVRYEVNSYILFRINSVFKGLSYDTHTEMKAVRIGTHITIYKYYTKW